MLSFNLIFIRRDRIGRLLWVNRRKILCTSWNCVWRLSLSTSAASSWNRCWHEHNEWLTLLLYVDGDELPRIGRKFVCEESDEIFWTIYQYNWTSFNLIFFSKIIRTRKNYCFSESFNEKKRTNALIVKIAINLIQMQFYCPTENVVCNYKKTKKKSVENSS